MSYPWDKIREVVEEIEKERLIKELSLLEQKAGTVKKGFLLTEGTKFYLEFLGMLSLGLGVGIFSLIFNYILFVWLLHLEF
jgi:hypothetical protein